MKNRHVIALAVAGVALATLAWFSSREKKGIAPQSGAALLPGLDINTVDAIEIATATETVRVARAESGWQLPDRYYYPANFETIRQFLLKLENLKIGLTITASEPQREQMGLSASAGTVLRLKSGGRQIREITLGTSRQSQNADAGPYGFGSMPDGRYVALNNDPAVYLIRDSLHEVTTQQQRWMETTLLDVASENITSVTIENPDDGNFTLKKGSAGKWDFAQANSNTPFDDAKSFSLSGALSYLTLQDVADPVLTDEELGFTSKAPRFQVAAKNGTTYDITMSDPVSEGGDRYIRIAVGFDAPPLMSFAGGDEAQAKAADAIIAAEEARNNAAALHAKLSPWTFRIASYKANALAITRESLIKKPEPPAENSEPEQEGTVHEH